MHLAPRSCSPNRAPRPVDCALLAVLCALSSVLCSCNRSNHPAQVGEKAPAFVIHDGAQSVSLRAYRGKTVVLNFWASWCGPCVVEFPSLVQLQRDMPNVVVLAVAFDTDEASYRQFLVDNDLSGIVTIDDLADASNHAFGTYRPPESYIIDSRGLIRRKFIGMPDGGWTNPEILTYLRNL
jgi:cytochrome c biogenesis protein CcmG, thiol:disulfide interchange protein DsbE